MPSLPLHPPSFKPRTTCAVLMPTQSIQFLSLMHLFVTQPLDSWRRFLLASETGSGKSLAYHQTLHAQASRRPNISVASTPLPEMDAYTGNGAPCTAVTGQSSDDRQGGRGSRMNGSNKHFAGFLKPILNKVFFPDVNLVWHSGHDWPAVDEQLDRLIAVAHGKRY